MTDVVAIWKEGVEAKDLRDAIVDLIDAIMGPDDEEPGGEEPGPDGAG